MTIYPSLAGRRVRISGGNSGIGSDFVRSFVAQGVTVAFCGTNPNGGDELIKAVKAAGQPAPIYAACDVRDAVAYRALLGCVIPRSGPIRVLVNNAVRDDAQCLKIRLDAGHVSRVALFMAADDNDGMTGQHVLVDAGIAQCSVMG